MKRWKRLMIRTVLGALACFAGKGVFAQYETSSARYMHSQYFINPAYSATSNVMTANLMARKQWFGIEGSPSGYRVALYSPINKTLMSVGGGVSLEQHGINKVYVGTLSYAYLVKLSPVTFLSLGISANAGSHQIAFNDLNLTHNNDPSFSSTTESQTILNAAGGAYLYSRSFYMGLSVSNLIALQNDDQQFELSPMLRKRQYYMATGYNFNPDGFFSVKPSVLCRYESEDRYNVSGGIQLLFNELFWVGATYGNDGWMSSMLNVRVNKNLEAGYIFDFASGINMINRSSHEIVITYSLDSFMKNNKNRAFGVRKAKKDKTLNSIKSMRNF